MDIVENKKLALFLLLLIIAVAIFFRLWKLDSIPPGLYPDVAINGNDALTALKTGDFKVFYPENNGREGLFMNLIALSFLIFGLKIWAIKIVAAIFGILTVFGIYLLAKELFSRAENNKSQATIIAFLSSFFLAVSFWHTLFSRIGFRAIMVPFVLVFGIYFLVRAFRTKNPLDFIFAGIFWGIGFHTYIAFRMAVIILGIIFILKIIEYFKNNKIEISWNGLWNKVYIKDGWWKFDLFLLVILLVALPIGIYFLGHPQDFMGRAAGVSIFKQENPVKAGILSLVSHLGMFNFHGDANWRHNFAGSPMLFWPIGILFLIGVIFSTKEIIRSFIKKNFQIFTTHLVLFAWFFSMLLPGILTYEGIPHALRIIGVIPVAYLLAGIGGWLAYEWLKRIIKNKKLLFALCSLFIVFIGFSEFNKYFFVWAKNENVQGAFTKNFADVGYYLNSFPQGISKYVIVNVPGVPVPWPAGLPMPAQTAMFIESTKFGNPQSIYLLPESLDNIKIEEDSVIVLMKNEKSLVAEIQKRWPDGEVDVENEIWAYKVNF